MYKFAYQGTLYGILLISPGCSMNLVLLVVLVDLAVQLIGPVDSEQRNLARNSCLLIFFYLTDALFLLDNFAQAIDKSDLIIRNEAKKSFLFRCVQQNQHFDVTSYIIRWRHCEMNATGLNTETHFINRIMSR